MKVISHSPQLSFFILMFYYTVCDLCNSSKAKTLDCSPETWTQVNWCPNFGDLNEENKNYFSYIIFVFTWNLKFHYHWQFHLPPSKTEWFSAETRPDNRTGFVGQAWLDIAVLYSVNHFGLKFANFTCPGFRNYIIASTKRKVILVFYNLTTKKKFHKSLSVDIQVKLIVD